MCLCLSVVSVICGVRSYKRKEKTYARESFDIIIGTHAFFLCHLFLPDLGTKLSQEQVEANKGNLLY